MKETIAVSLTVAHNLELNFYGVRLLPAIIAHKRCRPVFCIFNDFSEFCNFGWYIGVYSGFNDIWSFLGRDYCFLRRSWQFHNLGRVGLRTQWLLFNTSGQLKILGGIHFEIIEGWG